MEKHFCDICNEEIDPCTFVKTEVLNKVVEFCGKCENKCYELKDKYNKEFRKTCYELKGKLWKEFVKEVKNEGNRKNKTSKER